MVGRKKWRLSCTPHCGSDIIERVPKSNMIKLATIIQVALIEVVPRGNVLGRKSLGPEMSHSRSLFAAGRVFKRCYIYPVANLLTQVR